MSYTYSPNKFGWGGLVESSSAAPQPLEQEFPETQIQYRGPNERPTSLTKEGWRWFCMFPADQRPVSLAAQYPRVVNELGQIWETNDLHAYAKYIRALLISDRSDRAGFPVAVTAELIRIQSKVEPYLEQLAALGRR